MSYGARFLAAFAAVAIGSLLPAQDKSPEEPTPKELYMRSRQLPYHATEDDKKDSGQTSTGGKDSPHGKKGKTGGRNGTGTGATSPEPVIGIRYWILKADENGQPVEVPTKTEFHNGDRIKVRVEVNTSGYLYILNQGPTGNWDPEFPSPKIASRDNRVSAGRRVTLPPEKYMEFSEPAGAERLVILFARKPEDDFEAVIQKRSAAIHDDVMTKKRELYSRDLRIEDDPPPQANQPKDKSAYAVKVTDDPNARVFLEVSLVHK
jgi:hypothetical protein